jgi:hypothetical protein
MGRSSGKWLEANPSSEILSCGSTAVTCIAHDALGRSVEGQVRRILLTQAGCIFSPSKGKGMRSVKLNPKFITLLEEQKELVRPAADDGRAFQSEFKALAATPFVHGLYKNITERYRDEPIKAGWTIASCILLGVRIGQQLGNEAILIESGEGANP